MAYLNVKERVIETKIVYFGAGLSGKTTNLEQVKKLSIDGKCGEMMSLDTDGDRTLFFDWLPFNIGKFNGCDVKIQLYTVPGQPQYAETRRRVLAGADGVVLVLDSESGALERNRQSVADLREHLRANGMSSELPMVVQLNKRDLPTAMAATELLAEVGLSGSPHVEAVAAKGDGVFETLREASRLVLQSVREAAKARSPDLKTGTESGLDGGSLYKKLVDSTGSPPAARVAPNGHPTPAPAAPSRNVHATFQGGDMAIDSQAIRSGGGSASSASTAGGASPAQIAEIVAGHRALARRLDQVEQAVGAAVTNATADLEKRLGARMIQLAANGFDAEALDTKLAAQTNALGAALMPVAAAVEKMASSPSLGAKLDSVSADLSVLKSKVEGLAIERLVSVVSSEISAVATKLLSALKAEGESRVRSTSELRNAFDASLNESSRRIDASIRAVDLSVAGVHATLKKLVDSEEHIQGAMLALDGAMSALRKQSAGTEEKLLMVYAQRTASTVSVIEAAQATTRTALDEVGELVRSMHSTFDAAAVEAKKKGSWWR